MKECPGSVLNQVLLHQTVIGLETQDALKKYESDEDAFFNCLIF